MQACVSPDAPSRHPRQAFHRILGLKLRRLLDRYSAVTLLSGRRSRGTSPGDNSRARAHEPTTEPRDLLIHRRGQARIRSEQATSTRGPVVSPREDARALAAACGTPVLPGKACPACHEASRRPRGLGYSGWDPVDARLAVERRAYPLRPEAERGGVLPGRSRDQSLGHRLPC